MIGKDLSGRILCECGKPTGECPIHGEIVTEHDATLDLQLADLRREADRTRSPEARIILYLLTPILIAVVRRLRRLERTAIHRS